MTEVGRKEQVPFAIAMKDGKPYALAGLWEEVVAGEEYVKPGEYPPSQRTEKGARVA